MTRYIIQRLLLALPVLLGVSFGVFLMVQFVPGDPATVLAGDAASPQMIAALRQELGLDQPIPVQYLRFLERLVLHGSLGNSTRTQREVLIEIADRFPYTLLLTLSAVIVSTVVGVLLGIFAAINHGRAGDFVTMMLAVIGLSVPSFWIALLMIMLFALNLHWLPVTGAASWQNLIMPTVTLSLHSASVKARVARASMLEVMGQEYVRTARAKGLREKTVIVGHALKNALIPIVTLIGLQFGGLLGGAFITETIFGWPGVGRLAVQSIFNRDFPVIQGTVLLVAVAYLASNLIVDIVYGWLDPRIRYN
jgi:ABC-type dipeptide/oligopeptide/nickel transport system permease component